MEFKCEYRYLKDKYICFVDSASIEEPGTTIKGFHGNHNEDNYSVHGIYFDDCIIEYFPRGLHIIFPNLKIVSITSSRLKEISREDLVGLEKIEELQVSHNQLRSLPSNLFEGMKELTTVSFFNNKLMRLSSNILIPIVNNNLKKVDFRLNCNVNAFFSPQFTASISLDKLMAVIDNNCICTDDELENHPWTSDHLSDFTLICGHKSFHVHKKVLSAHSSVFAKMCEENKKLKLLDVAMAPDVISQFLHFIYKETIQGDVNFPELLDAANVFDVPKLKIICEAKLLEFLDYSNAYDFYSLGKRCRSPTVSAAASKAIKNMFPEKMMLTKNLMEDADLLGELYGAAYARKRTIDEADEEFAVIWKKKCEEA